MRSVRQSLASSTTERGRFPLYCSSLVSKRANSANASAVEPAKPASTLSLYNRRSFLADALITSLPSVTCPSPAITTLLSRRTQITVVDRIFCGMVGATLSYRLSEDDLRIFLDHRMFREFRAFLGIIGAEVRATA